MTALLAASLERAGKGADTDDMGADEQAAARRGLERLLAAWKKATRTDERDAMLDAPDVDVLPSGGRADDKRAVRRSEDARRGRPQAGSAEHPVYLDPATTPDATGRIW